MTRLLTCLICVALLAVGVTGGQPVGASKSEKLNPAPMDELFLVRATATEENDEVVVRISQRGLRLADQKGGGPGGRDYLFVWGDAKSYVLGDQVVAFSRAGKPLDKKAVAKALTKTTSVPCLYADEDDPGPPDPVYREAFREDVVFLAIRSKVIQSKPPGDR